MMRIVYDNLIFKLRKYGGITRYFSELIRRTGRRDGVFVKTVDVARGHFSKLSAPILDIFFFVSKSQLYHPTYYSSAVKRRKSVKTVITVFDMIHELFLWKNKNFQNDILVKKKSILEADHIICISGNTQKDLLNFYPVPAEKTSVIYLGAPRIGAKTPQAEGLSGKRSFILFVGKRDGYKNFPTLLEAFSRGGFANDFSLVCFGGGAFSKEENNMIEQKGLTARVYQFDGDDQSLAEHYKNAEFLVYPSAYEGFGLPLVEAMAWGCPVVSSNAAALAEISGGATVLFHPENPDELASAMNRLLNSREERMRLRELGLNRSREFSWVKTANQTYELYNRILSD